MSECRPARAISFGFFKAGAFCAALMLCGASMPLIAEPGNNRHNRSPWVYFRISEQSLAAALQQYARQAKVQILFSAELVKGLSSRALFGYYPREQALRRLLACKGLDVVFSNGAAAIKRAANDSPECQRDEIEEARVVAKAELPTISEIIVTAQRRAQRPQDIGIAITTFQGSDINALGYQKAMDMAAQTPSVTIKNVLNKAAPIFSIRGIGNTAFTSNSVSPVGVYVDELFVPSHSMLNFSLFDIERIEVLKGPQGTLFGRNTTAGTVNYITRRPDQAFDARTRITLADHDVRVLDLAVGGGLSETLSGRVALKGNYQGRGFFTNKINGTSDDLGETNRLALRASLLWQLEELEVYWNFHGGRDRSENEPWVGIGSQDPTGLSVGTTELPGGALYKNSCSELDTTRIDHFIRHCVNILGYRDPYPDPRKGEFSREPRLQGDSLGSILNFSYILDFATLSSISAYEASDSLIEEDFDGGPFAIGDSSYGNDIRVLSQEFRLTSRTPALGSMDWVLGLLYYRDDMQVRDLYGYRDRVNHDVSVAFDQQTRSWALWGHSETQLGYHWTLVAGLRYTADKISFDGGTRVVNRDSDFTGEATFFSSDPLLVDDNNHSTEFTGKLGLNYTPTDEVMLYTSVNRGYKAGVWNGFWTTRQGDHTFTDPEYIDAVEAGFKLMLMDSTLLFNGAYYLYDYTDIQLFANLPDGRFTVFSAGKAKVKGSELELWWRPALGWNIKAGAAYNRSKVSGGVGLTLYDDVSAPNTPKWSFNALVRHQRPLFVGVEGFMQLDFAYQDEVYFSLDNQKAVSEQAYLIGNLHLGIIGRDKRWDLTLWIKNLADKAYFTEILRSSSAGAVSAQVGPPRTYGATFSYYWP